MRRPAVVVVLVATLAGCSGWSSPGSGTTFARFTRDHRACVRDSSPPSTVSGGVSAERYRLCMNARGWIRQPEVDPGEGWFRDRV
jgi:hypothetical protein